MNDLKKRYDRIEGYLFGYSDGCLNKYRSLSCRRSASMICGYDEGYEDAINCLSKKHTEEESQRYKDALYGKRFLLNSAKTKKLIESKGLTQAEVARRCNFSQALLNRMLVESKYKQCIMPKKLKRLTEVLECSSDDIILS